MKKNWTFLAVFTSLYFFSPAQDKKETDTTKELEPVIVTAFEQNRQLLATGPSLSVLSNRDAGRFNKSSLVPAMNTLAGVRVEERSPGSYRINIRGSSLRSPFGVRNVKVYWNGIPITDPGGNTYFNQFAFNNFSSAEIYKGPAGSLYGAGTGGLILLKSFDANWKPGIEAEYVTGSFGLNNLFGSLTFGKPDSRGLLTYAHQESDGYRDHTRMTRDNASFVSTIRASDKQSITASLLYNNLYYQTPGGLTLAEYKANPRQARPKAGSFPSAEQAKAAIYQKNITAGFTHDYSFSEHFRNSSTLYGSFTQVKNPTFRNYERRQEPSYGGRTTFIFTPSVRNIHLQWVNGAEWQQGLFNTQVSNNRNGIPDTIQTNDDIKYNTYSIFTQADLEWGRNWFLTAGISINRSEVQFIRLNVYPVLQQKRTYRNEWSPRVALLKKIGNYHSLFASVSKGFSPPTISELLPSTGNISTFLQAEEGTNYELGGRAGFFRNRLQWELSAFYFKLNNALVVRKDSANADYYVNAGDTRQRGIELTLRYRISGSGLPAWMEYLDIRAAQTIYHFTYGDFQKGTTSYKGNRLPSVPDYTLAVTADLQMKNGLYLNSSLYSASQIYLNDANTVNTSGYRLLGGRIGWKIETRKKMMLHIYLGADNLLNKIYSLGNDINASGGRYYNAAAGRNYFAGIGIGCHK